MPVAAGGPDFPGKIRVYDDPEGDPLPAGITAGPDRALWFTDTANGIVGRITTRGKYTMQNVVGAPVSIGITVGPDQNLWFTLAQQYGGIGTITTSGAVTLFNDPGGAETQSITTGPDGALWFTESNGTVGRMTTSGSVTHFSVAPGNAELKGIVTGPDGNLWVTQYVVGSTSFSNQVIRITPSGKSKSFTVGSGPDFICVGADRALWFTEADSNALGRITTTGKYHEYPTGFEYLQPSGIAAGPDGALWFSDFAGRGVIGRMTTKGKVRFFRISGAPRFVEITPGPDTRMWFTSQLDPSGVGRISTH
jgi:virginiamycin B lyase